MLIMSQGFKKSSKFYDKQSHITVSTAYPICQRLWSTSQNATKKFHARPGGSFREIKHKLYKRKLLRTTSYSSFLGGSRGNRDKMGNSIQFRTVR